MVGSWHIFKGRLFSSIYGMAGWFLPAWQLGCGLRRFGHSGVEKKYEHKSMIKSQVSLFVIVSRWHNFCGLNTVCL